VLVSLSLALTLVLAGEVRGRVLDAGADVPVAAAALSIEGNGVVQTVISARDGAFQFASLTPGRYTLLVSRSAYLPTRLGIVVPDGSPLVIDVQLTRRPVPLSPIVVQASSDVGSSPWPVAPLDARAMPSAASRGSMDPLAAQAGAVSALLGSAGRGRDADPGSGAGGRTLYIWGAREVGARVTLDGIPLGAPLHLGGLLPVIDEDVMQAPRLWTGGAPARVDGGTGYVLDLATRAAARDTGRAWVSWDGLTERVGGHVSLGGRANLLASGRRVNDALLDGGAGGGAGYGHRDALVRLEGGLTTRQRLTAVMFASDEGLDLPRDQGRDAAHWRNRAGGLRWERVGVESQLTVRASLSDAAMELPLLSLRNGHLRADALRSSLHGEQRWWGERWEGSVGVEVERLDASRLIEGDSLGEGTPGVPNGGCDTSIACTPQRQEVSLSALSTSWHADHRRQVTPRVVLSAGVRLNVASGVEFGGGALALPRAAIELTPWRGGGVRLSTGRFSGLASFFDPVAAVQPTGSNVVPALASGEGWMGRRSAMHWEVGASQRRGAMQVGLVAYAQDSPPVRTQLVEDGAATRARGVDVTWQLSSDWGGTGVTYSRVARRFDGIDSTGASARLQRLEQLASVHAAMQRGRWHGRLVASYAHGLSFASVVLDRPSANTASSGSDAELTPAPGTAPPQRAFLRLDATFGARACLGAQCAVRIAPYVRILNPLDRRDALFYYRENPSESARHLGFVPALVTVGARVDLHRTRP